MSVSIWKQIVRNQYNENTAKYEREQEKTLVGNIYKGKIESIVPSVGAAFVDIGLEKKGFLYLSDYLDCLPEPLDNAMPIAKAIKAKVGQEVLVQLVKEPYRTKGPRVTTHVSLAGRYLVFMPQDANVGVSRKIEDNMEYLLDKKCED